MSRSQPEDGPLLSGSELERTWLDATSWVDVARGWLDAPEAVFDHVRDQTSWRQGRLWRYERWVEEPRLGGSYPIAASPHPAIVASQRTLQHRYGVRFGGIGLSYYRDGTDLMAFHRDRDLRFLDETVIALLVVGARRPFHLRPRANRYDHEAADKGATHDLSPGHGDLIVMGGACQAAWEHSVPRAPAVREGRISLQWRWTSGRGRPVVGPSYRAPRNYSR